MIKKVFLLMVTLIVSAGALAANEPPVICDGDAIHGKWKWHKYIYDGQEFPPNNPDLNLTFEFFPGGKNRLHWDRNGEKGFCERYGNYLFAQCQLIDQVTWVNPKNAFGCGSDPDMRIGRQTQTRAEVKGDEIFLYLSLGGKPFVYVWKKQN